MITVLFQLYLSSLLIAFAAGIGALYYNKKAPAYMRILPWFMLLIFAQEKFAYYWSAKYGSNHNISNIFLIIQHLFYFFVLYNMLQRAAIKKWVLVAVGLYTIMAVSLVVFIQGINHYNSTVYFVGGLMLCFFSGCYLVELFRTPGIVNQFRTPSSWIACAILLYYSCTMPIVVPWTLLMHMSRIEMIVLHIILTTVYCISYLMFGVAFLCHVRTRKVSIPAK